MTFTCGAGAHYNILYGLSRPRSWSTPPPVDRQGLTWRLSEWGTRPNRAPGAAQLPPVDLLAATREVHEPLQRLRHGLHARVAHLAEAEAQLDPREKEKEIKSHFPVFEFAIARLS